MLDLSNIDIQAQLVALDRVEAEDSLAAFVRMMWPVIEPATPLVTGWAMDAICEHLEAVTYGDITRLLINVPPGSSKSLLCNVFWPAWEWALDPHLRYLSFSYAAHLTRRDNRRFHSVLKSEPYKRLFGDRFSLAKEGEEYVSTDKTGFKVASSIGGVGTGERGDRVILDDPHNVKDNESDIIRAGTIEWFATAMSNRLNDMEKSAIVVIMQRVHEEDVSGYILDNELPYEHLMIPAEFEADRPVHTVIGWTDPREKEGDTFWPVRFPKRVLDEQKKLMGPFGYASQYQQRPAPKGGGIIKQEWWQVWDAAAFPPFDYVLASLDTAYTEKTSNDYSALTIWGVFTQGSEAVSTRAIGRDGRSTWNERAYTEKSPKVMLMSAWQGRLELHDLVTTVVEGEKDENGKLKPNGFPGVRAMKIDKLLIEAKAAGHSVAQEIRRIYGFEGFGVQLHNPGAQDKVARMYSVQHLFAEKIIFAPNKEWAGMVIRQAEVFPKGKHDDLVDTVSMGVRHLRDLGLLTRSAERMEEVQESLRYQGREPLPLYPA